MSVGKVQLVSMDQLEAQGDAFYEAIRWRRCQVRAFRLSASCLRYVFVFVCVSLIVCSR